MLVAALTSSEGERQVCVRPMSPSMLYVPAMRPADLRFTTAALSGMH